MRVGRAGRQVCLLPRPGPSKKPVASCSRIYSRVPVAYAVATGCISIFTPCADTGTAYAVATGCAPANCTAAATGAAGDAAKVVPRPLRDW